MKNNLKISIDIKSKEGITTLNYKDFDSAILGLVYEREWYNYEEKSKLIEEVKKGKVFS
jgi:hypothetical protein